MPWELDQVLSNKKQETNGINRPKMDNKSLFNNNNDNYVEDIEELAL